MPHVDMDTSYEREQEGIDGVSSGYEGNLIPAFSQVVAEKNEELAAIMHQLDLSTQGNRVVREEVEGFLGQAQRLYEEVIHSINSPSVTEPLPSSVLHYSPDDADYLQGALDAMGNPSHITRELSHNFVQVARYAASIENAPATPSILNSNTSLGRVSIDLMTLYDAHHEKLIVDNLDKTKNRNKQLAALQEQLSVMYEQRAKDGEIDRALFEQKYNEARDLLAEFTGDLEDVLEYISLPELEEGFVPTEEGIRSFCQKLELMKIRVQGSISDLANEMHKFVQIYTIIIDIMKNMLEMDRNEREAIVRRTGQ